MGAYLCKDAEHAKQAKQDETENQMLPASEKIKKQEKEEVVDGENPDIPFADATADEEEALINETPGKIVNDYNKPSVNDQDLNEEPHSHVPVATHFSNDNKDINQLINEQNSVEIKPTHEQQSSESCKTETESNPEKSHDLNEHVSHDCPTETAVKLNTEEHHKSESENNESENQTVEHNEEHHNIDQVSNVPEVIEEKVEMEPVIDQHEEHIQDSVETADNSTNLHEEVRENVEVNIDLVCLNTCPDTEICDDAEMAVKVEIVNTDEVLQKPTENDNHSSECIEEVPEKLVNIVDDSKEPLESSDVIHQSEDVIEKQEYEFQESSEIEKELVNLINEEHVKDLSEIEALQNSNDNLLLQETNVTYENESIETSHDQKAEVLEDNKDKSEEEHVSQMEHCEEQCQIEKEVGNHEKSIVEQIEESPQVEQKPLIEDHESVEEEIPHGNEDVHIDDQEPLETEICHPGEDALIDDQEPTGAELSETKQELLTEDNEPVEAEISGTAEVQEMQIEDQQLEDLENQEPIETESLIESSEQVKENEKDDNDKEEKDHCSEDQDYDEEIIIEDQDHSDELIEDLEQAKEEISIPVEDDDEVECVQKHEEQHNDFDDQLKETNELKKEAGLVDINVHAIGDIELSTQPVSTNGHSKSDVNESDDLSISNELEIGNEIEDVKEEELIKMVSDAVEEIMGDAKTEVQHIVENSASKEPSIEALES